MKTTDKVATLLLGLPFYFLSGCQQAVDSETGPILATLTPAPITQPTTPLVVPDIDKELDDGFVGYEVSDVFGSTAPTDKFDFLWVIDNSLSMEDIHKFLRQNLKGFVRKLQERRNIDWQMAVTLTDVDGSAGALVSGKNSAVVVRSTDADPFGVWDSIIANIRDSRTAGFEKGIEASRLAILKHHELFSRHGVPLAIIYVSDEDDQSGDKRGVIRSPDNLIPIASYVSFFNRFKKITASDVLLYPIVHLQSQQDGNFCDPINDRNARARGSRYIALQRSLKSGSSQSICSSQLASSIETVAALASQHSACFKLSQTPQPNSLEISVDGETLKPSAQSYTFDESSNQICFQPGALPAPENRIVAQYFINDNN